MDTSTKIGKRIKELRKSYKLNQTDFAKPLGISYGHISNLEQGKDMPSQSLVKLMAYEYNTSEEWILNGDGDMFTHKPYKHKPSNMEKTNLLMLELDDILCEAPSSIRTLQENILETIVLLFNVNSDLNIELKRNHLEILNNMLKNLYSLNTHLIVSKEKEESTAIISHQNRIENLMDEIYQEFATELENFKNIYSTEDDF